MVPEDFNKGKIGWYSQAKHNIVGRHIVGIQWPGLKCLECWFRKGFEHTAPKYASLTYWLLWAEGRWEQADVGSILWPHNFYLKAGNKISREKGALPIPRREEHYHWGLYKINQYKQTY